MALAQLQFASGDRAEAIDIAQSIVAATDGDKRNEARIALAKMAATEQKLDEAENSVDAVIGEDPKNADALGVRAWIRLTKSEVSKATDDLLVAVNEAPQNAQLIELLGEAYERAGLVTLAEEQYAKALSIGPNPADAGLQLAQFHLRYGRTEQARRVLEDVLARAPKDRRVLTLLARLRLATQDWVGAQEIADKLRTLDKGQERYDSRQDRGRRARRIGQAFGQHQSSEGFVVDRWRSTGGSCRSRAGLCSVGADVRRRRPAQGAAREEPEKCAGAILLGSIYASTQRMEAAEKAFKDAVAADNGPLSQVALAQFYAASGRLDEAEKTARAGIERDPASNTLRFLLASILQRTERFSDAIALYEDMYKADPESTAVANDLASLLSERRGDPASLERAFTIAQRFRNSEIPQYVDTLGWIYYLRGEYASALPLIKSAAGKLPNVGLVQYHLGMVQKELGQNDLSIASLEKAISQQASMTPTDLEKAQSAIDEQRAAAESSVSN